MRLHGLDLFSGIGGISLALRDYVQTIAYCENNKFAQATLLSRMQDSQLDRAPIWDDVTTLDDSVLAQLPAPIDIILAGFPCQQISCSGSGEGLEGNKSGLFFEILRIAHHTQCQFLFLENSPAIRNSGRLHRVLQELAAHGYDARWTCLSASSVGAPHHRDRWWLLAKRKQTEAKTPVADAVRQGRQHQRRDPVSPSLCRTHVAPSAASCPSTEDKAGLQGPCCDSRQDTWGSEPGFPRVAHGVPDKMDRVHALGNSVVPQQARAAFEELLGKKINL